jgi:hypothetical protein
MGNWMHVSVNRRHDYWSDSSPDCATQAKPAGFRCFFFLLYSTTWFGLTGHIITCARCVWGVYSAFLLIYSTLLHVPFRLCYTMPLCLTTCLVCWICCLHSLWCCLCSAWFCVFPVYLALFTSRTEYIVSPSIFQKTSMWQSTLENRIIYSDVLCAYCYSSVRGTIAMCSAKGASTLVC